MALEKQNPAGANSEACKSFQLGRQDTPQDTASLVPDQVIGTITKNKREEIRVSLRTFNDDIMCDVRVYKNLHGTDIATAQGVTIRTSNIRSLIETLELTEAVAREEGLIV
jgi:hypothetical protein